MMSPRLFAISDLKQIIKLNKVLLPNLNLTVRFKSDCFNNFKKETRKENVNFGIMFDIDGVLLRGTKPIPEAIQAIKMLVNRRTQEFDVPCLFCTNAFGLRETKAATLSKSLNTLVSTVVDFVWLKLFNILNLNASSRLIFLLRTHSNGESQLYFLKYIENNFKCLLAQF